MKAKKSIFQPLVAALALISAQAEKVGEAEALVVAAEEESEKAKHDNGDIAPEKLLDRRESAERSLKIRKIEANRAAVKLEEAEEAIGDLLKEAVPVIYDALMKKAEDEKARIGDEILNIVGNGAAQKSVFGQLIECADPLVIRHTTANKIMRAYRCFYEGLGDEITRYELGIISPKQLAEKIIEAESLI